MKQETNKLALTVNRKTVTFILKGELIHNKI